MIKLIEKSYEYSSLIQRFEQKVFQYCEQLIQTKILMEMVQRQTDQTENSNQLLYGMDSFRINL